MEGMEGMEQQASMRFFGSIPFIHTSEVWNVSSLRDEMPKVTAFIDDLRAAFGAGEIDGAIRAGLKGRPFFWAREGGHELGTPLPGIGGSDGGRGVGDGAVRAPGAVPGAVPRVERLRVAGTGVKA
jgi:hypothetical protein